MKNLIGLWSNLSRAYEIALLGNFSIKVVFDKNYQEGFDDYETIKSFYKDVVFSKDGDLTLEIYKPDYNQNSNNFEKLSDIIARVDKAKKNIKPDIIRIPSGSALLKSAAEKLSLSISKIEKIKEISGIIAQLDDSDEVLPQHIAEAIQYSYIDTNDNNYICNAEEKSINFGYGISILQTELDRGDIERAIQHLNNLL